MMANSVKYYFAKVLNIYFLKSLFNIDEGNVRFLGNETHGELHSRY